jgi:hypothetical protein
VNRVLLCLAVCASFVASATEGLAKPASGFPDKFLGRWGGDAGGCSPGAIHGGLSISRKTVADGEFRGEVQSVTAKADGSIDVKEIWDVPEEGPSTFLNNYRLADHGRTLILTYRKPADTKPDKFIRCGATR